MANDAFIEALADAHQENLIDLAELRGQCLAQISGGGGEVGFIVNASQNNKTTGQECRMDATELLAAVNRALHLVNGTAVTVTYVDFSCLR